MPSSDSETVLAGATQLTDLIAEKTGIQITPVVATDFSGVVEAVCNGEAEMAALNTFSYILAHSRGCADVAMVSLRFGSAFYSGQIITRADSGIETLADLAGKTFCRPDPLSTSGWVVPSITLQANGINPDTDLQIVDAGGHPQVVTAVLNGDCDAGATFVDARTDEQKADTIVVAESAPIPNDTISFATDFDAETRDAVVAALLEIASDPLTAPILSDTYNWGGLAEADDGFFDDFRQQLDAAGVQIEELAPTPAPAATSDTALGTEEDPIVWAFVPSADSETVLAGASQLTDLIQEQTGLYISPVVATDFSGVIEAMCNGEADLGALNTFSYILAHRRGCADVAMVSTRFGSTYYSGQIITRADSGIETLADLVGKTFCRPDPLSTSGWIVPSITLRANGVNPDTDLTIVDAGGHDSVVTGVINGDCDAGATFVDARTDEQKADTVVIQESAPIPNDTISFAANLPEEMKQQIVAALTAIGADEAYTDLLTETYNWGGLVPASDAFFDDFRQQLDAAGISIDDLN
ncbi:MAG: phosphate/phosphite/phosphonate ABC transporter substrate-binding protein [Anaerolineae bacterium]|nr:phosphate/phosphite/phosphonate ABC transporter substrate-binding protein [Anaerolineae bacterium]